MISFCNKSSFDDQYRVVFIDNIETLNTNSVNAILKVIEEPNEKIFFFLIFDSSKNLLNTLSSRCINFNITLKKKQKEKVLNKLLDSNFLEDLNNDFKDYFLSPGDYINLYNYFNDNKISFSTTIEEFFKILFTRKDYKNSLFLKNNLSLFIELYFKKKFINFNSKIEAFSDYKYFLNLLSSANKYNLDLESVIMEFELKLKNG